MSGECEYCGGQMGECVCAAMRAFAEGAIYREAIASCRLDGETQCEEPDDAKGEL